MGVDFQEKVKRSFKKHLDIEKVKLATPDLFTCQPVEQRRALAADVLNDAHLPPGQTYVAEPANGTIVLRDCGLTPVAVVRSPPADILSAVYGGGGVAKAVVQEMHTLSGVAEVTIC